MLNGITSPRAGLLAICSLVWNSSGLEKCNNRLVKGRKSLSYALGTRLYIGNIVSGQNHLIFSTSVHLRFSTQVQFAKIYRN